MAEAQDAISGWPVIGHTGTPVGDACRRLLDALGTFQTLGVSTGWRDVGGLVRQVLLTDQGVYGGAPQLTVPSVHPWPSIEQWRALKCRAISVGQEKLRITADQWLPSIDESEEAKSKAAEQMAAVYRGELTHEPSTRRADPFWQATHGYDAYRGAAQQQAARAAVTNDGQPLLISLPTGRGKTAVAWSRALLATVGVTVVIVPTVVLALDMERRTRIQAKESRLPLSPVDRYAYIGSLDPETKRVIRSAVRAGTQRIIYASPEAFVSGLSQAIMDAAQSGLLQQIVVDEAHLVDQWGNDFRPEFQMIPALAREAYERAPAVKKPSVLLMSATIAQRQVELLTKLFGHDDVSVELLWGSALRAEPAYFVHAFVDEQERVNAVVDAVSMLPRPMILYTTTVADANEWVKRLSDLGLQRVGIVTGKSSDLDRQTAVEKWRGLLTDGRDSRTQFDIMVGTSAFGLGIDVPDVRTIVHACLPESIDRYYQEVGRAGRDGRATAAVLYAGPRDSKIARRLASATFIGEEKGWNRWRALVAKAERVEGAPGQRYRVKKSTLPTYMDRGFGESEAWNIRTLTLMAQAGVVALRAPFWIPPVGASPEEAAIAQEQYFENAPDLVEFELLHGDLMAQKDWVDALSAEKSRAHRESTAALRAVENLVAGCECVGMLLARHYGVAIHGGRHLTAASCRSCPWCRANPDRATGIDPAEYSVPRIPSPRNRADPLRSWRGRDAALLFIALEEGDDGFNILRRLATLGVNVYYGLTEPLGKRLQQQVRNVPIIRADISDASGLAEYYHDSVVFVANDDNCTLAFDRADLGLPTYLIAPDDIEDPQRPGWKLRDTHAAVVRGSVLLREL
ncbi:protein DpdF [Orlajensenia leifsoniae]|uniref:protein DpdF n=1 Tax=Orlajensenia leifsoniae TaxID=2561933 RepID=UPI00195AA382|nr:protein DpdF [Leifsonia flava]